MTGGRTPTLPFLLPKTPTACHLNHGSAIVPVPAHPTPRTLQPPFQKLLLYVRKVAACLVSKWGCHWLFERDGKAHALCIYGKTCIWRKYFYTPHQLETAFARQIVLLNFQTPGSIYNLISFYIHLFLAGWVFHNLL